MIRILAIALFIIGIPMISIAHGQTSEDIATMKQYCLEHTDDIKAGKNPLQDLLASGVITNYFGLENKTCSDIPKMEFDERAMQDFRDLVK
jgi:hypothetical protein